MWAIGVFARLGDRSRNRLGHVTSAVSPWSSTSGRQMPCDRTGHEFMAVGLVPADFARSRKLRSLGFRIGLSWMTIWSRRTAAIRPPASRPPVQANLARDPAISTRHEVSRGRARWKLRNRRTSGIALPDQLPRFRSILGINTLDEWWRPPCRMPMQSVARPVSLSERSSSSRSVPRIIAPVAPKRVAHGDGAAVYVDLVRGRRRRPA